MTFRLHLWHKILLITLLFGIVLGLSYHRVYAADDTGLPPAVVCNTTSTTYNALYQASADTYDVYVRLGKKDQTAIVSLSYQDFSDTECKQLGTTTATGNSWTKVAVWNTNGKQAFGTFTLASDVLDAFPGANRPTVLLVSQTHPVCQPTVECNVTVSGKQGALRASGTLLNEDSLHVVAAKDPASDTISSVDYFVDNKSVYSKKQVEPFDLRYVSSGNHTLATVATYTSKQQVVFTQNIDRDYTDDLGYLLFTFYHGKKTLLLIGLSILVAIIVLDLILYIARVLYKRHLWKITHIAQPVDKDPNVPDAPVRLHILKPHNGIFGVIKPLGFMASILLAVIMIIMVLNTWVVQIFQVDGPSMQSTLHTGEGLLVNKLGKTVATISKKPYVPKRGEVVIFRKQQDVVFEPVQGGQPTYVVKRVIGLPGERVVVKDGIITVYNKAHSEGFNPDANKPWTKDLHTTNLDDIDITLAPDEIFVSGDNRPDSIDSRSYGPVKLDELVGDATVRVLPLNKLRAL